MIIVDFRKKPVLVFLTHWLAWLLLHFITFLPTLLNSRIAVWTTFFFTHFLLVSLNFFLFFIVAFAIMPAIMKVRKKWLWLVIGSLILTVLFTYLKFRLERSYTDHLLSKSPIFTKFSRKSIPQPVGFFSYYFRTYFQFNILTNLSVVILAFAYRLLLIWFQQEKIRTELQNQTLRAELSFLKMQVNPHFLFNALNNIYSLAVIEDSPKTSNSVLQLSDLMRYMLYEKEDENHKVSLEREIHHINNYIDLEKLRHADAMYINFSIEGDVHDKRIAPLLLFPLIENAFKHGLVTDSANPLTIQLKIENKRMKILIGNFKNAYQKDKAGGIGVQNVKKRLDLLYKDNYTLHIDNSDDRYIVNLDLPL
ncbi:MAG TPA: histidine kinase [Flavisolibacter sp.]|nr:histidine kinase [Flavisolibacter sp.]